MTSDADRLWREACNLDDQGRLEEAILAYELAVAAGSTDAMVNLAMIFEHRTSPPKLQEAIVLNERAAAGGNARSRLGTCTEIMRCKAGKLRAIVG